MSRYIDADNAIERLGAYLMADAQIEYGGMASEDINDWKELASDILKGAPSIDIVRCKECRKSHIDGKTTHYLWCTEWGRSTDTFGYCERGERESRR